VRAAILALALLSSGCATIVKGGRTDLEIASPTPGAEAVVKSFKGREVYAGPLPAKVRVQKSEQYVIIVTAKGFREQKLSVTQSLQGWTFGNLVLVIPVLWGVGVAVDAMSGALWTLDPETLSVRLVPEPAPAPAAPVPEPVVSSPPPAP
jgi:hypothetical protein